MRGSDHGRRGVAVAATLATLLVGACAAAASPPPPTEPRPTPVITPDPHLSAPASVDDVFRRLGALGLRITPNTATGGAGREPVKRIIATYASWPLVLSEYSSVEALATVGRFDPKRAPGRGEAPFILAGLNILVEFGPHASGERTPAKPDGAKREAFLALVDALDPLLGPLAQRAVEPVPLPTLTPRPTVAVSAPAAASRHPAAASVAP